MDLNRLVVRQERTRDLHSRFKSVEYLEFNVFNIQSRGWELHPHCRGRVYLNVGGLRLAIDARFFHVGTNRLEDNKK